MRLLFFVACLAFILTTADAFYAYLPLFESAKDQNDNDKSTLSKRVARLEKVHRRDSNNAAGSSTQEHKSGRQLESRSLLDSLHLPTSNIVRRWWKTVSYVKRASESIPPTRTLNERNPTPAYNFPYVTGKPQAFPTSVSLDQDGSDFSYFTTVKVGSGGKEFHMLVDTGASESWVMSAKCTTRICSSHNTLGPADSSSLVTSDSTWNVTYGTGNVSGTLANDVFVFAGLNVTMAFGLAELVSSEFANYPIDGILGLGRTKPGEYNSRILVEALRTQRKLKRNVMGINLHRAYDNTNDGVVNFGEWDPSRFIGELTWVNTTNTTGAWEIRVDDAGSGGQRHQFVNRSGILDTGSSLFLLPPDDAKKLHEPIPGMRQNGEQFLVPCTTSTEIHLVIGGAVFPISPDDYVGRPIDSSTCNSNIVGRRTFGPRQWLLGDTFLKNVYTIFDWDQNRVGFGHKVSSFVPQGGNFSTQSSSGSGLIGERPPLSGSGSATSASGRNGGSEASPTATRNPLETGVNPAGLPTPSVRNSAGAPSLFLSGYLLTQTLLFMVMLMLSL